MDPIAWLCERLQGFPGPHQDELLKAIADFALLWSFFEGLVLATGRFAESHRAPRQAMAISQIGGFADHLAPEPHASRLGPLASLYESREEASGRPKGRSAGRGTLHVTNSARLAGAGRGLQSR
jgi:hypothetical protein